MENETTPATTNAIPTPKTAKEQMQFLGLSFGLALIAAIAAKLLIPNMGWQTLFGIIFFGAILEIILGWAEQGSATGRTLTRLAPWGAGVLVFLAISVISDCLFKFSKSSTDMSTIIAMEILFSIVAVGITYAAITSDRARKWLYATSVVAFLVVLAQVKMPGLFDNFGRMANVKVITWTQQSAEKANRDENTVSRKVGVCQRQAKLYEFAGGKPRLIEDAKGNCAELPAGIMVLPLTHGTREYEGMILRQVRLQKNAKDPLFSGDTVWVEIGCFQWEVPVGPDCSPTSRLARK